MIKKYLKKNAIQSNLRITISDTTINSGTAIILYGPGWFSICSMFITPHYNDELNFAKPCYNEDKISRNLLFTTSKPTFTDCVSLMSGMTHSQRSKVPFTHFVFFSHVAFFNRFPFHHSLWATGCTTHYSSFSSQHRPWEIISDLSDGRPRLISFSRRQKCFVGLIRSLSLWFLQSVKVFIWDIRFGLPMILTMAGTRKQIWLQTKMVVFKEAN